MDIPAKMSDLKLASDFKINKKKKQKKTASRLSENFPFLVVKFSIYLNRHVFVIG